MSDQGLRSINLPFGAPTEVIGHADAGGGARSLVRIALLDFIELLLVKAGLDPGSVIDLQRQLADERETRQATDDLLDGRLDAVDLALPQKAGRYAEALLGGLAIGGSTAAKRARRDATGFVFQASGNFRWISVGVRPTRRIPAVKSIIFHPGDTTAVDHFALEVFSRPISNADNNVPPGQDPSDIKLGGQIYFTNLVLDPAIQRAGLAQPIEFDLSSFNLPPFDQTRVYWFKLYGQDGSNAPVAFGFAEGMVAASAQPAYARGWYSNGSVVVPMPGLQTIAFEMIEAVGRDSASCLMPPSRAMTKARGPLQTYWPSAPDGAALPDLLIDGAAGATVIPAQGTIYGTPSSANIANEVVTLQYQQRLNLAHQFVTGVSVRQQSNNALLVEGADYAIDYDEGQIIGLQNVASFNALVFYSGHKQRIDLVYADPITGVIGVANGTERGTDPQEYMPAVPSGKIALYRVLVTVLSGLDVVPVHQWRGFAPIGDEAEYQDWLERARRRLPMLSRLMNSAAPITWIGYGDSITEQGATAAAASIPGGVSDYLVPNGPGRDRLTYFYAGRLPADTINAISLFDTGDGAGQVHAREGFNWRLIEAIQARCSSVVTYKNLGIGGTTTTNDAPNGRPNATFPARITALLNTIVAGSTVVSIAFGMNELGSAFTYGNMRFLIQGCRNAGAEVIVWGVPLFARNSGFATLEQWRETNRQLMQAAQDEDVAFIPLHRLADPANMGGLGIPWRLAAGTNGINHPSPYELRRYGAFGSLVVPVAGGGSGWLSYSPAVAASVPGGTPPTFNVVLAKYRLTGKSLEIRCIVLVTAAGTGSGTILVPLPPGMVAVEEDSVYGDEKAINGKALTGRVDAGGSMLTVVYYDGSYPGQVNARLAFRTRIEVQ